MCVVVKEVVWRLGGGGSGGGGGGREGGGRGIVHVVPILQVRFQKQDDDNDVIDLPPLPFVPVCSTRPLPAICVTAIPPGGANNRPFYGGLGYHNRITPQLSIAVLFRHSHQYLST